jgi:hypothetical protein
MKKAFLEVLDNMIGKSDTSGRERITVSSNSSVFSTIYDGWEVKFEVDKCNTKNFAL